VLTDSQHKTVAEMQRRRITNNKKRGYRRGTARRSMSVEILSTAPQMNETSHLEKLPTDQWPRRSLKVVENDAIR